MQIDIPLADFSGLGPGMMPVTVSAWLDKNNISYEFVGSSATGSGLGHNGRSNRKASFLLHNACIEDMLVFKIHFPTVRVWHE